MRQLLTESIILGLTGGILGVLIGIWAINLLKSITPGDYVSGIANWNNVGLNIPVLAFTTHALARQTQPWHARCERVVTKETLTAELPTLLRDGVKREVAP